jgi:CelD/BcsL family acetyltransferase involved in cellulose biosynthesis
MVGIHAVAVRADACEPVCPGIERGGADLIDRYAASWEKLCNEAGSPPFLRPEWIAAYLRAFEPGSEIVLLTASIGEKLAAIMPLIRKSCWYAGVPMVKLAGPANAHSVQFDIARLPGAAGEAAVRALWGLLKKTPGWHMLELPVFPDNGACQRLMGWAAEEGLRSLTFLFQDSPILRMQPDGEGRLNWLGGTSRHFRHELRRFARLLEAETGSKPQLVRETQANPSLLGQFYELEAAGWKGHEGSAIQCSSETRAFYDQIAREAAARGYLRLYSLEVNGSMVAGAFGVTTEGCSYPMKIAYDEGLRRCGPGQLMFNGILEECAAKQIKELFFGGDRDRYKTSWTQDTLPHFNGFVFAPCFRTRLAYLIRTGVLSPLGRLRRRWRRGSADDQGRAKAGKKILPWATKKKESATAELIETGEKDLSCLRV